MHAEGGWEGFTLQTSGHFRLHAEVFLPLDLPIPIKGPQYAPAPNML